MLFLGAIQGLRGVKEKVYLVCKKDFGVSKMSRSLHLRNTI